MPVTKVNFDDLPPLRFQRSVITALPEWNETLKLLQKPLKPMEAHKVSFNKDQIAQMPIKNLPGTFIAKLRRWIKDNPSKIKADLTTRGSAKHGTLEIYIVGKSAATMS